MAEEREGKGEVGEGKVREGAYIDKELNPAPKHVHLIQPGRVEGGRQRPPS